MLSSFIAAFAVLATVVLPITAQAANPAPTGDLIFVRSQDFATFDPDLAQNDSLFIQQQVFEGLYRGLQSGRGVEPWLAKSYTTSTDGLTWTFKLRTDVKFSDGTPMTSADVKFSLDRAAKGDGWGFTLSAVDSVSAPAGDTVVLKLKYKWAPLLADLACFSNSVLKNNWGGKTEAEFLKSPIGTGPFVLDKWNPGTDIKLVANKNYWQSGKPYLNSVTWKYIADDNTREFMLKGGQADINEEPPAVNIKSLQSSPNIKVGIFPAAASNYLAFNQKVPALADVHVRRAISYAIDRAAINKVVFSGLATPSNSFIAPGVNFYDKNTPGIQFDLKKAAAELAQSKFKKGLKVELLIRGGNKQQEATASIVQASLKKIGITMSIKAQEPSVQRVTQKTMAYEMTLTGWTMDIVDPDQLLTFGVHPDGGTNAYFTNYSNAKVNAAIKKAQTTVDEKVRAAQYSFVQKQLAEDAFMAFTVNPPYLYAWTNKITGFFVNPLYSYRMQDVKKG